jgi:tetratricopeptide (TPR) repeat protein
VGEGHRVRGRREQDSCCARDQLPDRLPHQAARIRAADATGGAGQAGSRRAHGEIFARVPAALRWDRRYGERLDFTHDRIREVVYTRLLSPRRKLLHRRIAENLEALHEGALEPHYAALGVHFRDGEMWDKAVAYLRHAGLQAYARSAYRDAPVFFREGLAALAHLPESRATLEQAIDLRFDLRRVLFGLGELEPVFDCVREAQRLAEALGDQRRVGWASAYMTNYRRWVADHDRALVDGQRALDIAVALDDFPLRIVSSFYLGMIHHAMGDYLRAIEFLTEIVESVNSQHVREYFGLGAPPSVFAHVWLCFCLSERGDLADARARAEESRRIAEVVDHPYSHRVATLGLATLSLRQGTVESIIPALEQELAICEAGNLPGWYPPVASLLGAAYALSGKVRDGIALLEHAVDRAVAFGIRTDHSLHLTRLGKAYLLDSRLDDAERAASEALELAGQRSERGVQAWALKLQGDIVARKDAAADRAPDRYREALELAETLEMRPLQAHCHAGLGQCHRHSGNRTAAREHLTRAVALFEAMDMATWAAGARAELSAVQG